MICKNKFANPTPMGYSDINLVIELELDGGVRYLCEVQLNLQLMVDAKKEAHKPYGHPRGAAQDLQASGADPDQLEAYIAGRLNNSALDVAVAALSKKADGLFLYARLLAEDLEARRRRRAARLCRARRAAGGPGRVYAASFGRAFPEGGDGAATGGALVELIAAAMEPITPAMAAAVLLGRGATLLETTALLFPERDGKLHVFHKTVVDWLTGEVAGGSSLASRSAEFGVGGRGHAALAAGFEAWLGRASGRRRDRGLLASARRPACPEPMGRPPGRRRSTRPA